MILEVIGTNSAFPAEGTTVSFILWPDENKRQGVLLDCGYPVYQELLRLGYADRLAAVCLSHNHQDHSGSAVTLLEYLNHVAKISVRLGGKAWEKLLPLADGSSLTDYLPVSPQELQTFEVPHSKKMFCEALFVNCCLLYSGDTAVSLLERPEAQTAAMIIHDASLTRNPNHCYVKDLASAPAEVRAKTYLCHYAPKDYEAMLAAAKELGLGGVLRKGDVFKLC